MTSKIRIVKHEDWMSEKDPWHGSIEGKDIGTGVTTVFYATDEVGKGPLWHVHPYDEVFILRTGIQSEA